MKKSQLWVLFLIALCAGALLIDYDAYKKHHRWQIAALGEHYYEQALEADEREQKKKLLNQALEHYLLLLENGDSGRALNERVADISEALGELPWAALYSLRALTLDPGNRALLAKTEALFSRLGQPFPQAKFFSLIDRALVLFPEIVQVEGRLIPVLPGVVVKVLQVDVHRGVLRVQLPDGGEGYLPIVSAAVI